MIPQGGETEGMRKQKRKVRVFQMSKLKRILALVCTINMLFGNLSIGNYAVADTTEEYREEVSAPAGEISAVQEAPVKAEAEPKQEIASAAEAAPKQDKPAEAVSEPKQEKAGEADPEPKKEQPAADQQELKQESAPADSSADQEQPKAETVQKAEPIVNPADEVKTETIKVGEEKEITPDTRLTLTVGKTQKIAVVVKAPVDLTISKDGGKPSVYTCDGNILEALFEVSSGTYEMSFASTKALNAITVRVEDAMTYLTGKTKKDASAEKTEEKTEEKAEETPAEQPAEESDAKDASADSADNDVQAAADSADDEKAENLQDENTEKEDTQNDAYINEETPSDSDEDADENADKDAEKKDETGSAAAEPETADAADNAGEILSDEKTEVGMTEAAFGDKAADEAASDAQAAGEEKKEDASEAENEIKDESAEDEKEIKDESAEDGNEIKDESAESEDEDKKDESVNDEEKKQDESAEDEDGNKEDGTADDGIQDVTEDGTADNGIQDEDGNESEEDEYKEDESGEDGDLNEDESAEDENTEEGGEDEDAAASELTNNDLDIEVLDEEKAASLATEYFPPMREAKAAKARAAALQTTGYAALNIKPLETVLPSENAYALNITLADLIQLPVPEGMRIGSVSYELFRITEEAGPEEVKELKVDDDTKNALVKGIAFTTADFGLFILRYTLNYTDAQEEPADEPAEPAEPAEEYDYSYAFAGIGDSQLLPYILGANELYLTIVTAVVDNEEAVAIDEDLNVTANAYFDQVILTVTDTEGNEYKILLTNPDMNSAPVPVELTADQIQIEAYTAEEAEELAERFGLTVEAEENQAVGYAAFEIDLADAELTSDGGYIVPVTLETPITLPTKEGMTISSVRYDLFHIQNEAAGTDAEILSLNEADGVLYGFTFRTSGFSDYILRYTVEFHNGEEEVVIEGGSQILLSMLIEQLGLKRENGNTFTIDEVESVSFEDDALFTVEEVFLNDEVVINNGRENEKTVRIETQHDFVLTSEKPFAEVLMTLILTDGEEVKIGVTDAHQVVFNFYEADGVTPADADLGGYNYLIATSTINYNEAASEVVQFNINGSTATASVNNDQPVNQYISTQSANINSNPWTWPGQNIKLSESFDLGHFHVTRISDGTYKAVKKPEYTVNIVFPDGDGDLGSNFYGFMVDPAPDQNGNTVNYYDLSSNLTLNESGTSYTITSFGYQNAQPASHSFTVGDTVVPHLYYAQYGINVNNGEPANYSAELTDGSVYNGFGVSVETGADYVTYTLQKPQPYHYEIRSADNHHITLGEAVRNNWYLLSTLTKADGSVYYYTTPVTLHSNQAGQTRITGDIVTYYNRDKRTDLNQLQIGNEAGTATKTSVYQTGDSVTNVLVHGSGTASTYDQIVIGTNQYSREAYDNGSVIEKYKVQVTNPDTTGTGEIVLDRVRDLRVVTEFRDENGNLIQQNQVPNDYRLLIKMTDGSGEEYYSLHEIHRDGPDGGNPTNPSGHKEFRKLVNGNLSSEVYYYSGTETISTQVVTGTNDLLAAINGGNGVVKYNENTVGGTQGSDLTKDLYSTYPSIADGTQPDQATEKIPYILTTVFRKNPDNGVDHDITVRFYKDHEESVPADDTNKLVSSAGLDTAADSYFFRVNLYNNNKLVGMKIVPVSADSISAANSTGKFTQTIPANETFQLVDDVGVNIPGGTLHYDPSRYTSEVRFYKAKTPGDLPTSLQELKSKSAADIPGYDFWYNDYGQTPASPAAGQTITETHTDIGLYAAHKKIYQVKITLDDPSASIEASDDLDLNLSVEHATTGTDTFVVDNIPGPSTQGTYTNARVSNAVSSTENGNKVYTYKVEDAASEAGSTQLYWTTTGDPQNLITGNEDFTLLLKHDGEDVQAGYTVKVGGDFYVVSYDTGNEPDINVVIDDENFRTTITHYVHLTKVTNTTFDKAIGPYDVLGEGAEFGVVANTYIRHDHTETNFAVNTYNEVTAAGIDVDAAGEGQIPFYIGNMPNGMHFASTNTSDPDIYTPASGKTQPYLHTAAEETNDGIHQDSYDYDVTVIPTSQSSVSTYVSKLITKMQNSSASYVEKSMIAPSGEVVDTTMFPDNITIYVDAKDVDLATTGWKIKKLPGQSIVFNIPGDNVFISKEIVEI